jgi:hypothetical protein
MIPRRAPLASSARPAALDAGGAVHPAWTPGRCTAEGVPQNAPSAGTAHPARRVDRVSARFFQGAAIGTVLSLPIWALILWALAAWWEG